MMVARQWLAGANSLSWLTQPQQSGAAQPLRQRIIKNNQEKNILGFFFGVRVFRERHELVLLVFLLSLAAGHGVGVGVWAYKRDERIKRGRSGQQRERENEGNATQETAAKLRNAMAVMEIKRMCGRRGKKKEKRGTADEREGGRASTKACVGAPGSLASARARKAGGVGRAGGGRSNSLLWGACGDAVSRAGG